MIKNIKVCSLRRSSETNKILFVPRSKHRGKCGRDVALNTYPHLAPMLKKEYSYTSTPLLVLRGKF